MIMEDGLYIARFRTPLDEASGVVVVQGAKAHGGDGGMFYVGDISGSDRKIEVSLRVRQHDKSKFSVFGDFSDFTISLTGKKKGNEYHFEGRATAAPSLRFEAILTPAPE